MNPENNARLHKINDALKLAASLDTSQTCPDENHDVVVYAMDAIKELEPLRSKLDEDESRIQVLERIFTRNKEVDDLHADYVTRLQTSVTELERQVKTQLEIVRELNKANEDLRNQKNALLAQRDKNFWIWQGDGDDHLESLTCPIMIQAAELRELIKV